MRSQTIAAAVPFIGAALLTTTAWGQAPCGGGQRQCTFAGHAFGVQSAPTPYAIKPVPGGYRFEVRSGDRWGKDVATDHATERAELSDNLKHNLNDDFWTAYDLQIEPGPPSTARYVVIGQFHQIAQPGESYSPPIEEDLLPGDVFEINVRASKTFPILKGPGFKTVFSDPSFQRGRTYHLVYHIHLGPSGDGLLDVWRDGIQIVNYRGPLGYAGHGGAYFKFGLYRGYAPETIAADYTNLQFSDQPLPHGPRGG